MTDSAPSSHQSSNVLPLLRAIVQRLEAVGRTGIKNSKLAGLVRQSASLGIPLSSLDAWLPDRKSTDSLQRAGAAVSQLIDPPQTRRTDAFARAENALAALPIPHNSLVNLLRAYRMPSQRGTSPAQSAPVVTAPRRTEQQGHQQGSTIARTPAHSSPSILNAQAAFPDSLNTQLGTVQLSDDYDTNICIYLDETVPSLTRDFGVVAGIVWMASRPNTDILPIPKQHEQEIVNDISAFQRLAQCPHAIPFIFRYRIPPGHTQTSAYEHVVHECVLFLLGWVIPAQASSLPQRTGVRIVCESLGGHEPGLQQTDVLRGVLAQATRRRPVVFSRWVITEAKWIKKNREAPSSFTPQQVEEQGYLAYGDLLAYLTLAAENPTAAQLARTVRLDSFRNYITMTPDLVSALESLDEDAASFRPTFLDAMAENVDSPFMQSLMDAFREKWRHDDGIKDRLLAEIDRRFLQKDRDLPAIERQFTAVTRLVGHIAASAPRRVQLLDFGIKLQRLNHYGDPQEIHPISQAYADLRRKAFDNGDADLVAHIDLYRAVEAADRFEPGQAALIVTDLLDEEPRLSLLTRAKCRSALGQYLSMQADHEEARAAFDHALALMTQADLPGDVRKAEWLQTAIYRAINAIDSRSPDAGHLVEEIFDKTPWDEQASKDQFIHHLWLRYLHAWPEFSEQRTQYAEAIDGDLYPWHPWELIGLYRGLFLAECGRREDALNWLTAAIDVALAPPHGATLRLIAALIATAGFHATGDAGLRERASGILVTSDRCPRRVEEELPATAFAVETLAALLDTPPDSSRVNEALGVLRFNYR